MGIPSVCAAKAARQAHVAASLWLQGVLQLRLETPCSVCLHFSNLIAMQI